MNKIITFKDEAQYHEFMKEKPSMNEIYSSDLVGYMTNLGQYYIVKSRCSRNNMTVTYNQYLEIMKSTLITTAFT